MRALRVLLITAVVLGGLFVGVDRLAVSYAESEAADRVRLGPARAGSTEVDIKGFPFLTQLMDKRLDDVDVKLTGVQATAGERRIRISELSAALHDVTVTEDYASARAGSATGTALISYADLTAASDSDVTVAYGGDGKVKVTGGIEILGRKVTRSVLSTVTVTGGDTIRVRADEVPGEGIPGIEGLIRKRTDFDRTIGGLPQGMKLEKVEAREDGVAIAVNGKDVALSG
ncbi:LmeA family phospholipid-binding protein [Streptomyces sp. NPDC008121]|uniref:LmeA family phospholipid-binding protein n=1 Tax=Streptomyces sp. NPDC008121 TaxID=3364809 RepID=UPI0036EC87DC